MNSIDRKRYFWVIGSALAQGVLIGLYLCALFLNSQPDFKFLDFNLDLNLNLFLCMPLTLIVILPCVFWLAQEHWGKRLNILLLSLAGILIIFYLYRLWAMYPTDGNFSVVPSQKLDLIRACMAAFLIIPFFQCRIATWGWDVPYSDIFFQLCRNLFLIFQAVIVLAVFWGLLFTAGLLFDIVGLHAIPIIIFNPLVAAPVTSITTAVSITVALKHPGIDSLGRWILSVLAWLLPPFSIVSLVFIASLPYAGLNTLWDTGQASSLMLLLQLGTILLANASWLDGSKNIFNKHKHTEIIARVALLLLPVYSVLCLYSLSLRVEQYGLSVDRIQAGFMAVISGVWGIGYAGAVLLRKWPCAIGRVNIAAALFMTFLVAAMNSPLLDPYRLAANNQAERLLAGQINPEDFDYLYMRFSLGRYGNYALDRLANSDHPRVNLIRKKISAARDMQPQDYLKSLARDNKGVNIQDGGSFNILDNIKLVNGTGRSLIINQDNLSGDIVVNIK